MKRRLRILITAGPTREPIDPVRFLSNASSGAQGVAIAEACLSRGWPVDFVHGPMEVTPPPGVALHPVTTTQEMLDECLRLHAPCDVVIGAAAVCDFRPQALCENKQNRGESSWTVELQPTEDILACLGKRKEQRVHVGFALESQDLETNSARKLDEKNLDWIVGNDPQAIGADSATYLILGNDGSREELGRLSKPELAEHLCNLIDERLS